MPRKKQQTTCPHPAKHVHPTFDPRWEICDKCGTTARAPMLSPWIAAADAALPAEPEPPALAEPQPIPERARPRPIAASVPRPVEETPAKRAGLTIAEQRRRDDWLLGEEETPDADPDTMTECWRCKGAGKIADPRRRRCPRCAGSGQIGRYTVGQPDPRRMPAGASQPIQPSCYIGRPFPRRMPA